MNKLNFLPTPLYLRLKHIFRKTQFYGNFKNYDEASKIASGYKTNFEAHKSHVVPNGRNLEASQASIYFGLLMPPLSKKVLDWGGGLGSVYYEVLNFYEPEWRIIELDDCVSFGNENLSNKN